MLPGFFSFRFLLVSTTVVTLLLNADTTCGQNPTATDNMGLVQRLTQAVFPGKVGRAVKTAVRQGRYDRAHRLIVQAQKDDPSRTGMMPVSFNLAMGLYYDHHQETQESCDCYRAAAEAWHMTSASDRATASRHKVNGKDIDFDWFQGELAKTQCQPYTAQALYLLTFQGVKCRKPSEVRVLLAQAKGQQEDQRYRQSYLVAQGLHQQLCEDAQLTACKLFRQAIDLKPSTEDQQMLSQYLTRGKWLEKRVADCRYHTDVALELLQTTPCTPGNDARAKLEHAAQANEEIALPRSYLLAQAIFAQRCADDTVQACSLFAAANRRVPSSEDLDVLRFYPELSNQWLDLELATCKLGKDKKEAAQVKEIRSVMKRVRTSLSDYHRAHIALDSIMQAEVAKHNRRGYLPANRVTLRRKGPRLQDLEITLELEPSTTYFHSEVTHDGYEIGAYADTATNNLLEQLASAVVTHTDSTAIQTTTIKLWAIGTADSIQVSERLVYLGDIKATGTPVDQPSTLTYFVAPDNHAYLADSASGLWQQQQISLQRGTKISNNLNLAALRAQNAVQILANACQQNDVRLVSTKIGAVVYEHEAGPQYRKIRLVLNLEDLYAGALQDLDNEFNELELQYHDLNSSR